MARYHYAWVPTRWLWADKFNTVHWLAGVTMPKLIVHGARDTIVPATLGQKLYELAPEPKTFHRLAEAGHNDIFAAGGPEYLHLLKRFIATAPEKTLAKVH